MSSKKQVLFANLLCEGNKLGTDLPVGVFGQKKGKGDISLRITIVLHFRLCVDGLLKENKNINAGSRSL